MAPGIEAFRITRRIAAVSALALMEWELVGWELVVAELVVAELAAVKLTVPEVAHPASRPAARITVTAVLAADLGAGVPGQCIAGTTEP